MGRLLESVIKAYSDHFDDIFEKFAIKHGAAFIDCESTHQGEHKIEFTGIFEEYKRVFEELFEKAVVDVGGSLDEFYDECKRELNNPNSGNRFAVEMLISASEYERFYGLMRNEARRLRDSGEL